MSEDEYPQLIEKGFAKFYLENTIPHVAKYTSTQQAVKKMADAAKEEYYYEQYANRIRDAYYNIYGMPKENPFGTAPNGFDMLFNYCRGIKGLSRDIRRQPDNVDAACRKFFEDAGGTTFIDKIDWEEAKNIDYAWASWIPILGHTILSPKQFERFVWPYLNDYIKKTVKYDTTAFFFVEGGMQRFIDFFAECPSGHFVLWQEEDDIRMLKKALPGICHMGGLSTAVLGKGSVKENIDYAKSVIDDAGYDGKLILTTYKFVSYKHDCSRENFSAVMDFVREYGKMNK